MSAPITAYRKKSFFTRYNNTNIEHLIAIIQQSDAIHLSRFYLDGYMPVRLDDGKEGGIGYVIIDGENATMHNLNKRGGSQRMRVGGDVVQLLNDGGLNTFGKASRTATIYKWANNMGFTVSFKSSYYSLSSEFGVKHRKKGGTEWSKVTAGTGLEKDSNVTVDVHLDSAYQESEVIEILPYIINEEGESNMTITEVTTDENVWSYGGVKRAVSCSTVNQEGIIIWVKESQWANIGNVTQTDANTGIFLYTDVKMNTLVSGNFWLYGLDGNKSFRVQSGEIRMYENCTSTPPVVTLFYEMAIGNVYRFKAKVSSPYNQDITVTARIDISQEVTASAKYLTLTIPAGQTEVQEPITRDLSDNTYHFYNEQVTPASLTLVVTPL